MLRSGAVRVVGTMSGTSLDGVDAAEIVTDGERILSFGPTAYRAYSASEQSVLRRALGLWQGAPGVAEAARIVEDAHAEVLSGFPKAELIGFHGQTLAHDPKGEQGPPRTHQAGSGARLADLTGKPVVWDFRSADVELGGEGAPLAPFFHFACAKWAGLTRPVAFVNLGGVGNVTWLDPRKATPETEGALLAFDTGPANAPINDLLQSRLGLGCDEGGALAISGQADQSLVEAFLKDGYFRRIPPKSLDRNAFPWLRSSVEGLSTEDAAATLVACAAGAVAAGLEYAPEPPAQLYICGGGRHNRAMMQEIAARSGCEVSPVEAIGLNGDMLEAQAFGWLAVRVLRGLPTSGPKTTGVAAFVSGGQISGA